MKYPTDIQVAILFDRPVADLAAMVETFLVSESHTSGARYNLVEQRSGTYYAMYGSNELMVSFEYLDRPADAQVFAQALASPVTRLMCPEAADAIARHRHHLLISVQHGAMGGAEIQQMLAQMGMDVPGNGMPAFEKRLLYAEKLTLKALEQPGAMLVHWTLSNQLFSPDTFTKAADGTVPSLLHVHPYLFGGGQDAQGRDLAGVLTFGVRHFLGREIEIQPTPVPWFENWQVILTFLRVALAPNGYVVPDGDTFGDEGRNVSYRVRHLPEQQGQVPLYQLEPLLHRGCGFQTPDYVSPDRRIDPDRPPSSLMPPVASERAELMGEWRAKRAMAEGIGGSFEVKAKGDEPIPPPPPPGANRLGRVFGRRGS